MNKFVAMFVIFIASTSSMQFTFSELGFDVALIGNSSVYKEAIVELYSLRGIEVSWLVKYRVDGGVESSGVLLIIGVNNTNKTFTLTDSGEIEASFFVGSEVNAILLWINLTCDGGNVTILPDSLVIIEPRGSERNYEGLLLPIYITLYVTPIAMIVVRRFTRKERRGGEVVIDVDG